VGRPDVLVQEVPLLVEYTAVLLGKDQRMTVPLAFTEMYPLPEDVEVPFGLEPKETQLWPLSVE